MVLPVAVWVEGAGALALAMTKGLLEAPKAQWTAPEAKKVTVTVPLVCVV